MHTAPAGSLLAQVQAIELAHYHYTLPPARIAAHPLPQRDQALLLHYQAGRIGLAHFADLPSYLQPGHLLVLNDTRVVPARLLLPKATGAVIELFCLAPLQPTTEVALALAAQGQVRWHCLVGNLKRWADENELTLAAHTPEGQVINLYARKVAPLDEGWAIDLRWTPVQLSFAEVLAAAGQVPLPPYIKRAAVADDSLRYQTVYAAEQGAVAAPTAGLHMSDAVLAALAQWGVALERLTLHVGAGTFKPVTAALLGGHLMHTEAFVVSQALVQQVLAHLGRVVAVGTTSLRTLESLYWLGAQLVAQPSFDTDRPFVGQWQPYEVAQAHLPTAQESLTALLHWMQQQDVQHLHGETQILIAPGYPFRVVDGLVTNYHQPGSTLLLLIAAFIGDDWRRVYDYALAHDFRFLSYGDSSLLWRNQ